VVALEDADAAADLSAQGRMMLTMDAPDHTRYRSLVNRGFTPRMINALRPHNEPFRSRPYEIKRVARY
jgi:cholest-4-en-3-one 26-monooxygenase